MPLAEEPFWSGPFGDAYTARNAGVDWQARVPFWRSILERTQARSILEVGCNIGANLKAIREAAPEPTLVAWGCDVNGAALKAAAEAGFAVVEEGVHYLNRQWDEGSFDLVATVGLLIHVAPQDLGEALDQIIAVSRRYVLAVEYADETEVEVNYRGHAQRLWRRPFGRLYQDRGLTMVAEGEAPADAFDRCAWWLLSKAGT
jgi:pseudaminic acid biosynthesis-associated methylase